MSERDRVIVIGGGAAGMMAAITAAEGGAQTLLLERNAKAGRKLYITGKGRCNLTNNCPAQDVLDHVIANGRFLTGAICRTPPERIMERFEGMGVPLKTERGNRVFPVSDRAADVIDALAAELRRRRVTLVQDRAVRTLTEDGRVCGVEGEKDTYPCGAVVIATGGVSYPLTGSTGDGYEMARALGHTVVAPLPSLVPLEAEETFCAGMQGLSLRNAELTVRGENGKTVFRERGELLFTHFGVSGPLVLSASAYMRRFDRDRYVAVIDLKPALDEPTLDARLVRELKERANQDFKSILGALVPRSMIPVIAELTGIPAAQKGHDVSKEQRRRLLETLKGLTLHIVRPRPVEEAIVTAGGVSVKEIDPRTMGSKLVQGLYFAGEIMDVDALTGGFNLQIAWATGVAAGTAAAEFCNAK